MSTLERPPGAADPGLPRRADAIRNRDAILASAGELFVRDGWQTAMADVAQAAGVAVGTLYRHFPSKDALVGALLSRLFDRAAATVVAVQVSQGAPFERLAQALRTGAVDVATHPLTRLGGTGSAAWEHAAPSRVRFDHAYAPLVEAAHADGSLRADFTAADVGPVMVALCATVDPAAPDRSCRLLEILIAGLPPPGHRRTR